MPWSTVPISSKFFVLVIADFFRVLTNVGVVARSQEAIKMVQPLLLILLRQDLDFQGQLGGLQGIANILEKPMVLESLKMASSAIIMPLIPLLESESIAVQNATTELLTSLLEMQRFQEEITTKNLIAPLVKLVGIRVRNLQEIALMGLEKSSVTWTKEVADAGGIQELSKSTVILAIDTLIIHANQDSSSVQEMAEAGALDALLDLLRSHHCEELSARLLELILRNPKVRETKICQFVLTPLSEYILGLDTVSESAKILIAMALGDISQHEGLAKATDSPVACRALISLLEEEPSEEMQMVVIRALGNFAMHSRTSRKAMAEAGGVYLVQEMLKSCNPQVSTQAALIIKSLFSNHTLQEYVSGEIIKSLTNAMEREFWTTAAIPVLQLMMKSKSKSKSPAPSSFHERGNSLLNCLPGSLTVAIKRGDNLKRSNAFCRLIIDNCPTKKTKVVKRSSSPVWKESFTWDFEIVCKSNNILSLSQNQ
ncbi:hypothetical protein ARALYDRAFT_338989 [Arabidopsis lyrata subsp. lyrata]|uniref:C2 domain-containing protein n=1 Tax=Arabidopsis lyrata subsp. lyrata TaxID=81972 RepID=D7KVK4_ARALL|nr:hypothetical protein ARALYDRAFT_338989 [Arabidopsis lyrata subsp. lyrata]